MLTSATVLAGLSVASISLVTLVAHAADNTAPLRHGGHNEISVQDTPGKEHGAGGVAQWEHNYEFRSGKWAQTDHGFATPSTQSPQAWNSTTSQTRQISVIQDLNPPPPAQQRFQDLPPGSPYPPSDTGNAVLKNAPGDTPPAGSGAYLKAQGVDGDSSGAAGKAPGARLSSLTSLHGVTGMSDLFLNSRGGDQGSSPAVQTAGGGGSPGCTVACQNNLTAGQPAGGTTLPSEQISLGIGQIRQDVFPAPGGGLAAGRGTLHGAGGAANPTPNAIRILSNGPAAGKPAGSPANAILSSTVQSYGEGGVTAATRKLVGVRK